LPLSGGPVFFSLFSFRGLMRQIQFGAWLAITSVALAACSGEKFTSDGQSGVQSDTPTISPTAGTSHRNQGGGTGSYGGSHALGAGGQGTSAGMSSSSGGATAGSASGGTSSSAGSSYIGGGKSDGGDAASGSACPSGSITFRMLPGPDLAHDYLCDAGCGTGWLTITDADGALAYSLFSACGTASCDTCEVQPCAAAACLPTPLTATGSELMWTGSVLAKGTCGANMTCQKPDCVKPGLYKAKACAAINAGNNATGPGCMPKNEQLCAEATFEFPSTQTVKLILKKL
jgi:hypothetical protein